MTSEDPEVGADPQTWENWITGLDDTDFIDRNEFGSS